VLSQIIVVLTTSFWSLAVFCSSSLYVLGTQVDSHAPQEYCTLRNDITSDLSSARAHMKVCQKKFSVSYRTFICSSNTYL
jgi:hypothetical protein